MGVASLDPGSYCCFVGVASLDPGSLTACFLDGEYSHVFMLCLNHGNTCSHGEALTFEPLLVENKEESFLRDVSILAVATVTQVLILIIQPELKGLISLPLRVCAVCEIIRV